MSERTAPLFLRVKCIPRVYGRLNSGRGWGIAQMPIIPLERELARARQILSSWTGFKRLSSDEADVIARMIAQGTAEGRRYGLELAGAEWPTDGNNHVEELEDGFGAKARAILAEVARRFSDPNFGLDNVAGALGLSRRYVQKLLKEPESRSPSTLQDAGLSVPSRC